MDVISFALSVLSFVCIGTEWVVTISNEMLD